MVNVSALGANDTVQDDADAMTATNAPGLANKTAIARVLCPSCYTLDRLEFGVYYVVAPSFTVLGLTGELLLLWVLAKQARHNGAYFYQVIYVVSMFLSIATSSLYMMGWFWLLDNQAYKTRWYWWAAYTAHVASPLRVACFTNSLLMSIVIAADRTFAICKPFVYQQLNHKRLRTIAVVVGVTVSVLTSFYDVGRYRVETGNATVSFYAENVAYVESDEAVAGTAVQMILQLVAAISLICLNCALLISYRRYAESTLKVLRAGGVRHAKRTNRTLAVITILQCSQTAAAATTVSLTVLFVYFFPPNCYCDSDTMFACVDAVAMVLELGQFYVCIVVSKDLRNQFSSAIRYLFCRKGTVTTMVVSTNSQTKDS